MRQRQRLRLRLRLGQSENQPVDHTTDNETTEPTEPTYWRELQPKGLAEGTPDSAVCGLSVQLKSVRAINNIGAFANNKQQENPTTGGA